MPGSFRDEIVGTVRDAACFVLGQIENAVEFLGSAARPEDNGIPYPGLFGYRLLCNREPPSIPPSPFTGGQCDTLYDVAYSLNLDDVNTPGGSANGFPLNAIQPNVPGPIGGIQWRSLEGGSTYQAVILHGEGETVVYTVSPNAFENGLRIDYAIVTGVNRVDGLPDDCGNPPPSIGPPPEGGNQVDRDITYTDVNNIDITIPVTITFAPAFVNGDLSLSIPFQINSDVDFSVNLAGALNLSTGDVDLSFSPSFNVPGLGNGCEPKPVTDEDPPPIPDGVPQPEPPTNPDAVPARIIGVIVTSDLDNVNATQIFQESNPDVFAPRLGNIAFYLDIAGKRAWTVDIPIRNLRQYVDCPYSQGAVAVSGTPAPGVSWTLTPIYAQITDSIIFQPT